MVALNSSREKFVRYFFPPFIWAALIFIISSIPGSRIPNLFFFQDTAFHISEYAIFAWLINRALKKYYPALHYIPCFYLTVIISLIYAISDEFHQAFVPYRDPSLFDVSWDTIGAIIGSILYR